MNENGIRSFLQEADRMAGRPPRTVVDLSTVRRRANRRRTLTLAGPMAAVAMLMIASGIWCLTANNSETPQEQKRIDSLETQVKQLRASTDAALALVREVLEEERRQSRLEELEAELASIPDPLEEIEEQVDKTAFILVYQADRLYRELNETESAVETYNRVIKLFPKNQWAAVARQRLSEIEDRRI